MSLLPCKECGQEISSDAKTCPHCGKKQKKDTGWYAIAILLFLVALSSIGQSNPPFSEVVGGEFVFIIFCWIISSLIKGKWKVALLGLGTIIGTFYLTVVLVLIIQFLYYAALATRNLLILRKGLIIPLKDAGFPWKRLKRRNIAAFNSSSILKYRL